MKNVIIIMIFLGVQNAGAMGDHPTRIPTENYKCQYRYMYDWGTGSDFPEYRSCWGKEAKTVEKARILSDQACSHLDSAKFKFCVQICKCTSAFGVSYECTRTILHGLLR